MQIQVRLIDYTGPGYDTLPPEILLKIFQERINKESNKSVVLNYLGGICSKWTAVLSYPLFYETIDDAQLDLEKILFLCRKGWTTHTKYLKLDRIHNYVPGRNLELIFHNLPRLIKLEVNLDDELLSTHSRILKDLEKHSYPVFYLLLLNGERTMFPHMFYGYLHNNGHNLTKLTILFCRISNVLLLLNTIADFCPNLSTLFLWYIEGERMIFPVTKFQVKCPQMRIIELNRFDFCVDEKVQIGFPLLEVFLSRDSDTMDDQVLLAILRSSHLLYHLDVRCTPITAQGLLSIPVDDLSFIFLEGTAAHRSGHHKQVLQRWRHSLEEENYRLNMRL